MSVPDRIWASAGETWDGEEEGNSWDDGLFTLVQDAPYQHEYIRADLVPQWQPIETAPRDGTKFEAWHIVHKCVVTVRIMDTPHNGCELIEATMTTTWPFRAFKHWRPASDAPPAT